MARGRSPQCRRTCLGNTGRRRWPHEENLMQRHIWATPRGCLAASLLALSMLPATAQTAYPSKPITIMLGNSAGSGGDLLCRVLAGGLSASLKQMVIVENRPGANSTIA